MEGEVLFIQTFLGQMQECDIYMFYHICINAHHTEEYLWAVHNLKKSIVVMWLLKVTNLSTRM